ncbi:MAG: branched-chain amino acid ABC transporter permease [Pseudodesulfovibrio sp.]|uniref:Inner-membrane translocator n=1 Tax=Pseudodesulfovibrio aespoeensis (strain ATCC 700646 / DSM 10631 / Aspo-2) TaxID=643562 RepID=E6VY32_PSEA9|nr:MULTISPECIES: branched-chain amino acid ABC transporter permease [Pseudodesulfovibrio]MBU4192731.1 branched-chain amino acid ABC transporter permease [Pseudomonadota bacterium]ADU63846.1 inner-membrane translocator [Pseudodesulfovibrio aespoeensis Aspo-2]MBU4243808.1 branched-chain amino acid ABC transporter permease [Pseudomonadota bacterium]MBU4379981.1 branched-chain amino acid ABC transporter permease [Pseudomonadota bacterium]MBU4475561.1 branched-chain amino acid ABC transporter perme
MQGKCGLFFTSYRAEAQIFQSGFQKLMVGLFVVALLAAPMALSIHHTSIMNLIFISVIGAVGLNLLTGVCGQISLGHGAFIGVGAYAAGQCSLHGVPFPMAILAGGLITAMVGMVFGIPSLRLKGIYLAIATLAAQLVLEYVFLHGGALTGGSSGLLLEPPRILGFAFDSEARMYYLLFFFAACALLLVSNIMRTKYGRAFVSIRDFHLSAEIVGVNLFWYKLVAFGVSSFLAGVAGGLWGHYTGYISAEQFNIGLSISYLAMIIIGGMGSVLGSVFGAVFIVLLPEALNVLANGLGGFLPDIAQHLVALREGVFGLVLILFLIFEPEGLVNRWRLVKAYWKLYPFAH